MLGLSGSTEDTIRIGNTGEGMRSVGEDTIRMWVFGEPGKDPWGKGRGTRLDQTWDREE